MKNYSFIGWFKFEDGEFKFVTTQSYNLKRENVKIIPASTKKKKFQCSIYRYIL